MSDLRADILIVDDRPENLSALEAALEELGQTVVRAGSGQQALEILLRREFAVILLDVRMPEMDGFETAKFIRKGKRSALTPIIFITAGDDPVEQTVRGYAAGAVDYMVKPIQGEILRSKVRVFIDLFRKGKELAAKADDLSRANEQLRTSIEERKRADEELRHAYRELEVFSYTVAHDLRAPLRAMAGFSRILRDEYSGRTLDEAGQDYASKIEMGAKRMDALIQSLLAYCRVASATIHPVPVDLGSIIREVVDLAAIPHPGEAEVEVSDSFPAVLGHRDFLRLALSNLVSNALKFVDSGTRPRISIRHEGRGARVRLWIEDNGIGIDPLQHARIFGTFERLDPGTREGTGMGLAVVKAAMERMGGTVGLESTPGSGSRFWIELPKAGERPVPTAATESARPA